MKSRHLVCRLSAFLLAVSITSGAGASGHVSVAYFLEWAMPFQEARVKKRFDAAMDIPVAWTHFDSGTQMTEAMLAGDIDIAYSQGLAPFINAVNANAPIRMVAIAAQYSANDCVVRNGVGITSENASELEGRSVAVPLATMADYSFRMMMRALDVNVFRINVIDKLPADAAEALADGSVDMACGFGANSMARMHESGTALMTAAEKEAAGIVSFDVVTVTNRFASTHPELVRKFLEVTHAANADYLGGRSDIGIIARDAGLTVEGAQAQLEGFHFPGAAEQLEKYFNDGGLARTAIDVVGDAFATPERPALQDYGVTIDTSFLK